MHQKYLICCFFLLTIGKIVAGVDDGIIISDGNKQVEDECTKFCDRTYPAHTIEKSDSSNDCKQGCRLFTITELTAGAEAAKKSCDEGCADAYGKDSAKVSACKSGCTHQTAGKIKADENYIITVDSSSPMFHYYTKNLFNNVWSQMDHFHEQMVSRLKQMRSWMGFDDFDKQFEEMDKQFSQIFTGANEDENKKVEVKKLKGSISDQGGKMVGNLNSAGEPILKVQILDPLEDATSVMKVEDNTFRINDEQPYEPSPPIDSNRDVDPGDNFLAVLANRTGNLTFWGRWLLFFALMMCIIAMIYICLAVMRTAPRRYIHTRKLSIYGDYDEKFPLPDEDEAPPPYEPSGGTLLLFVAEEEQEKPSIESQKNFPQVHKQENV